MTDHLQPEVEVENMDKDSSLLDRSEKLKHLDSTLNGDDNTFEDSADLLKNSGNSEGGKEEP